MGNHDGSQALWDSINGRQICLFFLSFLVLAFHCLTPMCWICNVLNMQSFIFSDLSSTHFPQVGLTFFCFTEFVALPCADSGGPSRFSWPVAGGPVCVRCRWGQSAELQADLGSATYPWEWQGTHSTPKTQQDATGSHLNKPVNRNCRAGQQVTILTVELNLSSCCLFFNFDPFNMHIITFFYNTATCICCVSDRKTKA